MVDLRVKMSADDERLFAKFKQTMQKMNMATADASRKSRRQAKKAARAWNKMNKDAFGEEAKGRINSYNVSLGVIGATIGAATLAFREHIQVIDEAAAKQREAERGLSSLAQLAGGDPKRFGQLTERARTLFEQGAGVDINESARLLFQLVSAGAEQERGFFGQLGGIFEDPAGIARSAATIRAGFGQERTGSLQDIISRALVVSAGAPAGAGEILQAAAGGAAGGKLIGASAEELLAGTTIASRVAGGAARGGTQVEALIRAIIRRGLGGEGLVGGVEAIERRQMGPQALLKFLGRAEALSGFQALRENLPELQALVEEQQIGVQEGLAFETVTSITGDPQVAVARRLRTTKARLQRGREEEAFVENAIELELTERRIDIEAGTRGNRLYRLGAIAGEKVARGIISLFQPFEAEPGQKEAIQNQLLQDIVLNTGQQIPVDHGPTADSSGTITEKAK